jgi:hypothetical protein
MEALLGTYVVGDIHGCYVQWMSLKEKIEKQDGNASFIFVGDLIDRGPDTVRMLRFMLENVAAAGRYRMVIGNHEWEKFDVMSHYISYGYDLSDKEEAEYYKYYDEYDFIHTIHKGGIGRNEAEEILRLWKKLPFYIREHIESMDYYIAHADIPLNLFKWNGRLRSQGSLSYDDKHAIVWNRDCCLWGWDGPGILVHGHTPTTSLDSDGMSEAVPGKIAYSKNRINVDCGIVFKVRGARDEGNLAAIRLEDLAEFYAGECPQK